MPSRTPEPVTCQMVGCSNPVPWSEWPADRSLPKFCDPCLRATQARPSLPKRDAPSYENDTDFVRVTLG